jgi:hypothetical protein
MKKLIATLILFPSMLLACSKCDEVYSYVMIRQYWISNEIYYEEDPIRKLVLEAQEDILSKIRIIIETD